jgi:hypothetical protein
MLHLIPHAALCFTANAERTYLFQSCSRCPNDSGCRNVKSADVRCINKARLSKHIRLARVTDCEAIRATFDVFARSAAQLQKAANSGQQKVKISSKYLFNGKPSRWRMPHDHINMACKCRAPTLRGAEEQVVDVPAAPQVYVFLAPNIAQTERLVFRSRAHVLPSHYTDHGGWATLG